ncbi:Hypothetical predicted protein, partial [Mytilus galloprovincialis]
METTDNVLKKRQEEKKQLKDSFTSLFKTTASSVKDAKEKLDIMLDDLLNQLKITKVQHEMTLNDNIKRVTHLINRMKELEKVTCFIQKFGSATQLFIHSQRMTNEMYPEIQRLITTLGKVQDKQTAITPNSVLNELHKLKDIGELTIQNKKESACVEECNELSKLTFRSFYARKKQTIFLSEYELYSVTCISQKTIIAHVSTKEKEFKLIAFDTVLSKTITECDLPIGCNPANYHKDEDYRDFERRERSRMEQVLKPGISQKRQLHPDSNTARLRCRPSDIAYDEESKILVVSCSCYGKHLYSLQIHENSGSLLDLSRMWNIHTLFPNCEAREHACSKSYVYCTKSQPEEEKCDARGQARSNSPRSRSNSPFEEEICQEKKSIIRFIIIHNKSLFVIVGQFLMKIDVNMRGQVQKLHSFGYNYMNISKLAIDSLNDYCLITFYADSVVYVSCDGKNSFSERNESKIALNVAVKGFRLFLNASGQICIESTAGVKNERILIEKCEKIKRISDIWLDATESILFIRADHYIEL